MAGGQQVRRLQRVAAAHRVGHVPQGAAARREAHAGRAQQSYGRRAVALHAPAAALGQAHHGDARGAELVGGARGGVGGQPGQAAARAEGDPGPQAARHRRHAREAGRVGGVGVQVDGTAVLGGDLQDGLHVPRGVGVEVRAAADHRRAHLQRVAQHREPVRAGRPGQQPGDRDRGQLGEAAQRAPGLQDGAQRAQALDVAHAYVCAQRGRAVAELEQGRLGGAALDVLGDVRHGTVGVGGQGRVGVGVRLGGGRQQEVTGQVDA